MTLFGMLPFAQIVMAPHRRPTRQGGSVRPGVPGLSIRMCKGKAGEKEPPYVAGSWEREGDDPEFFAASRQTDSP
jgi:hypothetical protein